MIDASGADRPSGDRPAPRTPITAPGELRQVDGTTCGPSVLLALAALTAGSWPESVAGRFGAAQRRAHRQANRLWPRFLGTTPWGMRAWLHRHAPAAGRFRIRWTLGRAPSTLLDAVTAAATAGRPVPLMVGSWIPRHWVLVTDVDDDGWRVYEPSSGQVRRLDPAAFGSPAAARAVAWPRLHAVLLPRTARSVGPRP